MSPTQSTSRPSGAQDSLVVFAMTSLSLVGGIGVQSLLAYLLGPAGRGSFTLCLTFASIMGVAFAFGTDRATQIYVINGRLSVRQGIHYITTAVLLGSCVGSIVGWFLIHSSLPFFMKADRSSFLLALGLIPVLALLTAFSLLLFGKRSFAYKGTVDLVELVGRIGLLLLLVGSLQLGVNGALLAVFFGGILALTLQVSRLWRMNDAVPNKTSARQAWPLLLSYGGRYYVARMGNLVNAQIALIVIAAVGSRDEIGFLAAAQALVGRVFLIPDSIGAALLPRVGAADDGRPDLVAQACRVSVLAVAVCMAVILAFSNLVIPLMLSQAFVATIPLLWILAPGIIGRAGSKALMNYFIGVNRPGIVSISTGVNFLANVLVIPTLYHRIGLPAAAWAATAGNLLSLLVLLVAFRIHTGQTIFHTMVLHPSDLNAMARSLRGLLRRPRNLQIYPTVEEAEAAGVARYTVLLEDRIVKRQQADLGSIEIEKSAQGAAIGKRTGLFYVPRILQVEADGGVFHSERLHGVVPFLDAMRQKPHADDLLEIAGRSLAAIHREMKLPPEMTSRFPEPWAGRDQWPQVYLHGDYNTVNLLVRQDDDRLCIIDWATSVKLGTRGTYGPLYLDLAWFVAGLFVEKNWGFSRVPNREERAAIFVHSYFEATKGPGSIGEFGKYLREFYPQLLKADYEPLSLVNRFLGARFYRRSPAAFRSFMERFPPR